MKDTASEVRAISASHETREALKGFALAVRKFAAGLQVQAPKEYASYRELTYFADRLIRALEQEVAPVQSLRRPTVNLISSVKLAVLANGGFAHKQELCRCEPDVNQAPCEYCAIHEGLTKAFTFLRALELEPVAAIERTAEDHERFSRDMARITARIDAAKRESCYETWRDEQLDTLRKLYIARGPSILFYQSFPDFCREQWGKSDKGKVKV